jgi:quercetin dioxygenase-like cupin family protein
MEYKYFANIGAEVTVPPDGILSRTLHNDERLRVVLFAFSKGQQLTEHTASVPAVLHVLEGEAALKLGADTQEARAGTWVYMPAKLPHGIEAKTPLILLLLMLKAPATAP